MKSYDVFGIGSPLLDFIFEVEEKVLDKLRLKKGEMHLIDKKKSQEILEKLKDYKAEIFPGGSSANIISGVSMLGGKGVFLGKIGNDNHGKIYEQKTKEEGVITKLSKHPLELTGHALTFITPDHERTFATHLGAALYLKKEDIPKWEIRDSKILHLEGYQLEDPELKKAILYAIEIAKNNNVKISVDLSDSGLIKRNLPFLKPFISNNVDIVFVNESEAEAFTNKKQEQALHEISDICEIAIVKLGENGSLIKAENKIYKIPAYKTKVVNTNGAGDMYAAAMLHGISNNLDLEKTGKNASYLASLVVSSKGARLENSFRNRINLLNKQN